MGASRIRYERVGCGLRIDDGTLLLYRLFDVADDIDLAAVERLLAGAGERLRLSGERPGFLDLPDPPLSVDLGPRDIDLGGAAPVRAAAAARLFAHGVVSVRYEVPLPAGNDAALLAGLVRGAADSAALERAARAEAESLAERIAPALDAPHASPVFETYAILFARAVDGSAEAVAGEELARILLGEPPEVSLSAKTVEEVTRHRFAYTRSDLCVLDWDAALVVEPSGDRSVADVLELAAAQLLEFRYYDALFEEELLRVTALLGRPRAALAWLFVGRYSRVTRRVQHMVVESAEFVERVENAVRVVGDLYLSRLYRAAVERFRIPVWEAGVLRRQHAAAQVAELLRSEANTALAHILEASILGLIVLEIVLAL
jgi:hypothetical protein